MPSEEVPEEEDFLYSPPSRMGVSELPLEPQKLAFVVVFLVISGLSNWVALAYIHDIVGRQPLNDVVFFLIPEQSWALGVGDLMVTFCTFPLIVLFFLHKHRAILLRRTLFILGVLYGLRTVSMLVTQLPSGYANNDQKCRIQLNVSERTFAVYMKRILEQTFHVGFQDIQAKMLCGDLLYSGHTLIMVVCSLSIQHYLPTSIKWMHYFPKAFMTIGMCCMVMSRTHYSIDVLFAYCFSTGVFTLYHAFCEIDTYRERRNSVLTNLWILRVVSWLEENVIPGKIENKLEVPFGQTIYNHCFDPRSRQQAKSMSNSSSTAVMEPV